MRTLQAVSAELPAVQATPAQEVAVLLPTLLLPVPIETKASSFLLALLPAAVLLSTATEAPTFSLVRLLLIAEEAPTFLFTQGVLTAAQTKYIQLLPTAVLTTITTSSVVDLERHALAALAFDKDGKCARDNQTVIEPEHFPKHQTSVARKHGAGPYRLLGGPLVLLKTGDACRRRACVISPRCFACFQSDIITSNTDSRNDAFRKRRETLERNIPNR